MEIKRDELIKEGFAPCRFCGDYCMKSLEHIKEDWHGRGEVYRIESWCDEADEYLESDEFECDCGFFWKDEFRTEFMPYKEMIDQWNKMQRGEEDPEKEQIRNSTIGVMTDIINANGEKNGL